MTFDLEDVPLIDFLHHFLVAWEPGVRQERSWPGPQADPAFRTWPEPYRPPAAVQALDFVIHSGVQRNLKADPGTVHDALVTVKASGMPWNELFENVLASNGLDFALGNRLLFIARAGDLGAFEQIRQRRYEGRPITLNLLRSTPRYVLGMMGDITGLQLQADSNVTETITCILTERPVMEVFDLVLAANDLGATPGVGPDGRQLAAALRIRRLADIGNDAVDLSQIRIGAEPLGAVAAMDASARVLTVEGRVEVRKNGTFDWLAARPNMQLDQGDVVRARPGASAEIQFADGKIHQLKP